MFFYIERGEKERVTTFKEIVYFHENAPIHIHLGLWEYNNNIITMISSWNCISWPPLTLFICVYIWVQHCAVHPRRKGNGQTYSE